MNPNELNLIPIAKLSIDGKSLSPKWRFFVSGLISWGIFPLTLVLVPAAAWALVRTGQLAVAFTSLGIAHFQQQAVKHWIDNILIQDISAAAALVVLIFEVCLLVACFRHRKAIKEAGGRKSLLQYIYRPRPFPRWMRRTFIQLGLMGTLLAFALIAYQLYRPLTKSKLAESAAAGSRNNGNTVTNNTLVDQTRETSYQMFLMLCASLWSTFVGCLYGYFVVPITESIFEFVLGTQLLRRIDSNEVENRFLAAVAEATHSVGNIGKMAQEITQAEKSLSECAKQTKEVTADFENLAIQIEKVVKGASGFSEAGDKLAGAIGDIRSITATIRDAQKSYQSALEQGAELVKTLTDQSAEATLQSKRAGLELEELTRKAGESFSLIAQVVSFFRKAMDGAGQTLARWLVLRKSDHKSTKKNIELLHAQTKAIQKALGEVESAVKRLDGASADEESTRQQTIKDWSAKLSGSVERILSEKLAAHDNELRKQALALQKRFEEALSERSSETSSAKPGGFLGWLFGRNKNRE